MYVCIHSVDHTLSQWDFFSTKGYYLRVYVCTHVNSVLTVTIVRRKDNKVKSDRISWTVQVVWQFETHEILIVRSLETLSLSLSLSLSKYACIIDRIFLDASISKREISIGSVKNLLFRSVENFSFNYILLEDRSTFNDSRDKFPSKLDKYVSSGINKEWKWILIEFNRI